MKELKLYEIFGIKIYSEIELKNDFNDDMHVKDSITGLKVGYLIKRLIVNFSRLTDIFPDFYTTIFYNNDNRRFEICINHNQINKISYKKINYEKD